MNTIHIFLRPKIQRQPQVRSRNEGFGARNRLRGDTFSIKGTFGRPYHKCYRTIYSPTKMFTIFRPQFKTLGSKLAAIAALLTASTLETLSQHAEKSERC